MSARVDDALAPAGACEGAESFALRVLGDSMAPEFEHGDIVVIEPGGTIGDGRFVLAWADEQWTLRQLRGEPGAWRLEALDPRLPAQPLAGLSQVRGVVIQRARPGRRRETRHYT
jgi:DNA polymerase V